MSSLNITTLNQLLLLLDNSIVWQAMRKTAKQYNNSLELDNKFEFIILSSDALHETFATNKDERIRLAIPKTCIKEHRGIYAYIAIFDKTGKQSRVYDYNGLTLPQSLAIKDKLMSLLLGL